MKLGYVIVSNQIMIDRLPIGYLYREDPEDTSDSGWRMFSGEESQDYADNFDNFKMYNMSTMVEVEPHLKEIVHYDAPVEFELSENGYVKIES
jgi:hypothetical protein